jgi:hypothetical protein
MKSQVRRIQAMVRRKAVWGSGVRVLTAMLLAVAVTSCGDMARDSTASSYLIISALDGASGAEPNDFGGTVFADVITVVDDVPTIFADMGRVRFRLGMKDAGSAADPLSPTSNNFITVNRYRIRFIRADGRNTPGVDVPYPFDGAITLTVSTGESSAGFELVRHIAKQESPLAALARNSTVISTIAEVTFFGRDQTGREVSVTGTMTVDFGNFGDPE